MVVLTPTVAKKVSDKNMRAWVSTVYTSNLIKECENNSTLLESFAICLLKRIAKPVQLGCMWAGLAGLFSRQITNGPKLYLVFPGLRIFIRSKDG